MQRVHSLDTLWVENFDEIALSRTVKEIEGNLCFAIFGKNSKIQNGRHFWGGEIFFENSLYTLWVENFDEIALSRTVKQIEANLCFAIFGKNSAGWQSAFPTGSTKCFFYIYIYIYGVLPYISFIVAFRPSECIKRYWESICGESK